MFDLKEISGNLICRTRDLVFVGQKFKFLSNGEELTFGDFLSKIPNYDLQIKSEHLRINPQEFRLATSEEVALETVYPFKGTVYYLKGDGHEYFFEVI